MEKITNLIEQSIAAEKDAYLDADYMIADQIAYYETSIIPWLTEQTPLTEEQARLFLDKDKMFWWYDECLSWGYIYSVSYQFGLASIGEIEIQRETIEYTLRGRLTPCRARVISYNSDLYIDEQHLNGYYATDDVLCLDAHKINAWLSDNPDWAE